MLILERPWTRQPQQYERLDRSFGLNDKCIFSWVGNYPSVAEKRAEFTSAPTDVSRSFSGGGRYGPIAGASFNGSSSHVSLSDTPAVDFGSGAFAVEVLFRTTSASTAQFLLGKDSAVSTGRQFGISINEESRNGHLRLFINSSNDYYFKVETPTSVISANTWHHAFISRAAGMTHTGISIYIDGKYQTPTNAGEFGSSSNVMQASTSELRIGSRTYTGYFNYFTGDIAYLRIYKNTPENCSVIASELAMNPWRAFQPRRIPIPTAAAAAGAPTITALSAIGITATSAQPRISYS